MVCLTTLFMAKSASLTPSLKWGEVLLVLTDDPEIGEVHRRWMNLPEATDVLTQRYDPIPGELDAGSGEIVVNVQRAVEVAARGGDSEELAEAREFALYVAHGCDHLAGSEDSTKAGRQRMRRRELRWRREAETLGLLHGLLSPPRH